MNEFKSDVGSHVDPLTFKSDVNFAAPISAMSKEGRKSMRGRTHGSTSDYMDILKQLTFLLMVEIIQGPNFPRSGTTNLVFARIVDFQRCRVFQTKALKLL
jgi:hypothetical protein